jgi:hypothetical protein
MKFVMWFQRNWEYCISTANDCIYSTLQPQEIVQEKRGENMCNAFVHNDMITIMVHYTRLHIFSQICQINHQKFSQDDR